MARTIDHIQQAFTDEFGPSFKVSIGASTSLAHQVVNGAPYSLFISADQESIRYIRKNTGTTGESRHYATGRICFYIPQNSIFSGSTDVDAIVKKLLRADFSRFAIANPELAPYGRAARQALQSAGLWALDSSKFVIGENVAQTYQFVKSGAVDIGIIALSHFLVTGDGDCHLVPETWYQPIQQHMILLDKNNNRAREIHDFMFSKTAQTILQQHGYITPE